MGCGWCETKCPVEGTSAIRVNIIGEIRLASGSYVEKAREYGLVFEMKKTSGTDLAPGFLDRDAPYSGQHSEPKDSSSHGGELPPGFTEK